jgi:type 1 glutamine amidotransferase
MRLKLFASSLAGKLVIITCVLFCLSFKSHSRKAAPKLPAKVLVFSKTNGFRHSSIPKGIEAIKKLGEENNILVDATEDSTYFTDANLKQYGAIIFLSTTGNILGDAEEQAFKNFINNGGGFAGIHAATDCEYGWPWYVKLVGANFLSHPHQQIAKLQVVDKKHSSTKHLPDVWERKDEWYNFKNINPDIKVLIKIDETSYKGGKNGDNHPIAWYHKYDGGKVFYTELGHTNESFEEPLFLTHILGGIKYALGKK